MVAKVCSKPLIAFCVVICHLLPECGALQAMNLPGMAVDQSDLGFSYKSWTLKRSNGQKTRVYQVAVPTFSRCYWGDRGTISAKFSHAWSSFRIGEAGISHSFNNVSDIKVDGSYVIGNNRGLLTFGINLPAGDERLTSDEFVVAKVIAEDPLDFPLTLYGAGFEYQIGLFLATDFNDVTIGGGLSYFGRRPFRLLEDDDSSELKPGDEITGSLGLDIEVPYGNISWDAYLTRRFTLEFGGIEVFDPGMKFVLSMLTELNYPPGLPLAFNFWIRSRWRFDSEFLPLPDGFEEIFREDLNENPFQLEIGTLMKHYLGSRTILLGFGEFREFTANEQGNEEARVWSAGLGFRVDGLNVPLIDWLTTEVMVKYSRGHLDSSGERLQLSGCQISAGVRCSF